MPSFPKVLALVAGLIICSQALAGGSTLSSDVMKEVVDPSLQQTILKSFTLSDVADGLRIGERVAPNLGGARVGPYTICAKPPGAAGGYTLTLQFNTETHFKDARGVVVDLGPDAVAVDERVTDVQVLPASDLCSN